MRGRIRALKYPQVGSQVVSCVVNFGHGSGTRALPLDVGSGRIADLLFTQTVRPLMLCTAVACANMEASKAEH
jgi:hypothetical protein